MTARRFVFWFAFTAGLTYAQSPGQLEIRGTVVEGTFGIGGATVTLYEFGHTPAEATTRTVFATDFTDATGAFVFHPARAGDYYLEVKKEGYFAEGYHGPAAEPADSTGDPVRINGDHPLQERRFSLMRLGELRGRVVDEEGKPLANLRVAIRPGTITPVVTDQDGNFTAAKLRPGDYLVNVLRRAPEMLSEFSDEDLKIVDQDLQALNWPGVPVPVRSGASLSVGTITARKTPYYRAHVSVQSGDCAAGEKWIFAAEAEMAGFGPTVPCGKEFLIRNLAPGSYTFTLAAARRPGEARKSASVSVEVTDRNLEIKMTMSTGADISGRIIMADGSRLTPGGRIGVSTRPLRGVLGGSQIATPDPTGRFLITGTTADRQRVEIMGLARQFYVKEIRYNGLTVADGIFTPIPGAPGQLDIVIDNQAATINGFVAGYDRVSARVMVAAVKWPLSTDTAMQALLNTAAGTVADDQGRFQIGGLAPGEYRVLAVTTGDLAQVSPDAVSRAEKVTLERGGSQSVSLKIVEP